MFSNLSILKLHKKYFTVKIVMSCLMAYLSNKETVQCLIFHIFCEQNDSYYIRYMTLKVSGN